MFTTDVGPCLHKVTHMYHYKVRQDKSLTLPQQQALQIRHLRSRSTAFPTTTRAGLQRAR